MPDFIPKNLFVPQLLEEIDNKELALPEFQRSFIWQPKAICDLIRTVARDWPAGSFLLMEGPADFQCRALEYAPPLGAKKAKRIILDGQQRMTALYHAFRDKAPEIYIFRIKDYIESGSVLEDEHFEYKTTREAKKYKTYEQQVRDGIVKISTITDEAEWIKWLKYTNEDDEHLYVQARMRLPGLHRYHVPCVTLGKETELAAVAKIFETINRTGVRLTTFELMIAKLYPHKFHLRDKWEQAVSAHQSTLGWFSMEDEGKGIEILKLIALHTYLESGDKRGPKGVRESDILQLDADAVKKKWKAAINAYAAALQYLWDNCGVAGANFVPADAMLLPLALMFWTGVRWRAGYEDDIQAWFWASTFAQTYAQGANTRAITDARSLIAWNSNRSAVPDVFTKRHLNVSIFLEPRRRNEMTFRGSLCLLERADARDWSKTGGALHEDPDGLSVHHIFPQNFLESRPKSEREKVDLIANLTMLKKATNSSIRSDPPSEVVNKRDILKSNIESHRVPLAAYKTNDFNRFLELRAAQLYAMVEELGLEEYID